MLLRLQSFQANLGSIREAVAWARGVADYANQAFGPTRSTEVFTALFGDEGRIYFVTGLKDLGEFERWRSFYRTDQKWAELKRRLSDDALADPGGFRETWLESM